MGSFHGNVPAAMVVFIFFRFTQPSWLVCTSHPDQLVYLVSEQSLSVIAFDLSQEEFVGKVCEK